MLFVKKFVRRVNYLIQSKTIKGGKDLKTIKIHANHLDLSQQIASKLKEKAENAGLTCLPLDQVSDYIITVGGDGTLLTAFHTYQDQLADSQFIGVHTGHLGFYTDWLGDEMDLLIQGILDNDEEAVSYPLLGIEVTLKGNQSLHYLALNEFILRSHRKTMVCDVAISDHFFEVFRGDGLCIATPTGSTGMNKSVGGAVLHPRVEAIQMTELASVNNRLYRSLASPIILPKDEWLTLKPADSMQGMNFSIDNRFFEDQVVEQVRLQMSQQRIHFASFRHMHYWDRVEASFIGSVNRKPSEEAGLRGIKLDL